MKKIFVVEIEIAEPWIVDGFDFLESRIEESFQRGIGELLPYAYESETKVKVVEQTCRTLDNTNKMIDLLDRAKKRLNECESYYDGSNNDDLAEEIDQFIKSNVWRNT